MEHHRDLQRLSETSTSTQSPFGALSAAYRTVLSGGEYGGAVTATITLNNLTIGRNYAVQAWVSDARGGSSIDGRAESVAGSNTVTLAYNVPPATGGRANTRSAFSRPAPRVNRFICEHQFHPVERPAGV